VGAGKQVATDLLAKGATVLFHAAGSDGLGVIQAVKEAHAAGKGAYVIGVDSDQSHLAPEAVLTSMVKRVDLAVYLAAKDLCDGAFTAGDRTLGLKENGVGMAKVAVDFPNKEQALATVEGLRKRIVEGALVVPANLTALESFSPPAAAKP
jgi:basic membrane protein A